MSQPSPRHCVLRIIHLLRSPTGGLFRHVADLARQQLAQGHDVGIICGLEADQPATAEALHALAGICRLGLHRIKIKRWPGPWDLAALNTLNTVLQPLEPDILHGHGAKGGALARLANRAATSRVLYTPHGGMLHYPKDRLDGRLYHGIERYLSTRTDGLIFECQYGQNMFMEKIGAPPCETRVIHNGLRPEEFEPVELAENAADFLYIGDMRELKGVDLLLDALARLKPAHPDLSAVLAGDGKDRKMFEAQAQALNLDDTVSFIGPKPARQAFALGNCLVVPSRAESFPYIVLEAIAAEKPLIVADVGGISEILGPAGPDLLFKPDHITALATALENALEHPDTIARAAQEPRPWLQANCSIETMARDITGFYQALLATPVKTGTRVQTPS